MERQASRTGFFGKLATQGDFLSRRLSPTFVRGWDEWLQAGLQASRERLGQRWQQTFRCSPIWHFALAAGVCGEPGWAGLMMPSVDRVGRYFPLTLAYGGPQVPVLERLRSDGQWYGQLERLALSTLEAGFSLHGFDSALSGLAMPSRPTHWAGGTGSGLPPAGALWLALPEQEGMAQAAAQWLAVLDEMAGRHSLDGHALFWTEGGPNLPPTLVVSQGLPGVGRFVEMLGRG